MRASPIRLTGARLVALAGGALLWPAKDTLIVADLHLEKGAAYARRGVPLPPYDTRATLERLEALLAGHRPRRVVSLGDGFHDRAGAEALAPEDRARLRALTSAVEWLWVAGNHDPEPPAGVGGRSLTVVELAGLVLRHVPGPGARGEIAGHLHPKARLRVRGRGLALRCFASDRHRIVLPAFGSYAGGLDVFEPPLCECFPGGFTAHLLGQDRIHPFPHHRLDA